MSETLEYGAEEAAREEAVYRTDAAADRRALVRERLAPESGARVLSLGCGPGFEPAELADVVGPAGRVVGVDRSPAMLGLARPRCADTAASLARADALDLPFPDGAFDAAAAVQVYEYVDDVTAALDELFRVLRPGGRAVVYDTDFDSLVWRARDRERMQRVLDTYTDHCARPHLGSELAPSLRRAGFTVERVEPNSILNTNLDGTFAGRLMEARRDYVVEHGVLDEEEADAWVADLRSLDDAGGTFFNLTQYCYVARKPA